MKNAHPLTLPLLTILLTACAAPATVAPTPEPPIPNTNTPTPVPSTAPVESSDSAIYAAAIRQMVIVDNSFGDNPPPWTTVYVLSATDDSPMQPPNTQTSPTLIATDTQQSITQQLADLPFAITWIASNDEADLDKDTGLVDQGNAVIVTPGNIHMQEDGSAQVFVWLYCANLCAIGKTYVLEEVNGTWQVTGDTGPTIMS